MLLQPKDFSDDAHELLSHDMTPNCSYGPLIEITPDGAKPKAKGKAGGVVDGVVGGVVLGVVAGVTG